MSTGNRVLMGLAGALWVVIGAFFLINPLSSIITSTFFVAMLLIIIGVVEFIAWAAIPSGTPKRGWTLAEGIISILVGILILWAPVAGAISLPWVLGFCLLFIGAARIGGSFTAKSAGLSNWWLILILGILSIIIAFMLFYAPLQTFAIYVAVALIVYGVGDIISAFIGKELPQGDII